MTAKLTPLHRKFAALMASGEYSQTDAVRKLRPELTRPDVTGAKLAALPQVQACIEQLLEESLAKLGVTRLKILTDLVAVKDRCMQAIEVTDKEGNRLGVFEFREMGAIKALELLGRHKRMWEEKGANLNINAGGGGVQVNIFTGDAARAAYEKRVKETRGD